MSASLNKSLMIGSALAAALELMAGCGSGTSAHQQKQRIGNGIPAAARVQKAAAKVGAANGQAQNLPIDPKSSAALNDLDSTDKSLQNGTALPKLAAGTYKLATVNSSLHYMDSKKTGEELRASDDVTANVGQQISLTAPNSKFAGVMSNDVDSGRDLDLPAQFEVKIPWTPNRNDPSNLNFTLHDQLSGSAGSYTLKDEQKNPQDLQASLLKLLATSPGADGSYSGKVEGGVEVTVRVLSVDEQTVRFFLSFEEKTPSREASTTAQSTTLIRNLYLDYTLTPAAADATPAPDAPDAPAAESAQQ